MRKISGALLALAVLFGACASAPNPNTKFGVLIPPSLGGAPFDATHGPFYVAVTGNDGARGSTDAPWRTLDGARANVRPRLAGMTQDIYVYLGPGFSPNNAALFTDADSGTGGHVVHYVSQTGPLTARISGGTKIDTTTCVTYSGQIQRCPVGSATFSTLYEDTKRPPHARTPNLVFDPHFPEAQWGQQFLTVDTGLGQSRTVLGYNSSDWNPTGWNVADIRIRGESGGDKQWYEDVMPVVSFNTTAHTVTMVDNAKHYWFGGLSGTAPSRYFVECGLPCLDAVGEWVLDSTSSPHQLYIWPTSAISTTEIIYPTTKDVIRIVGADETHHVTGLSFENLTIEDSDFTPSYRWGAYCDACNVPITAPDWDPTSGAGHTWPGFSYNETQAANRHALVWMQNTDHVTFKSDLFRDCGFSCVHAYLYNQLDTFDNNGVDHAGIDGFMLEGGYPTEGDRNNNHTVTNNIVKHVGESAAQGSGVQVLSSTHNTISHNRFQGSRRHNMLLLGGCGSSLASDCYGASNVFSYNLGLDAMQDTADGGAYYSSGVQADGASAPFATNLLVQNVLRRILAVPTVTFVPPVAYYFDPGADNQEVRNCFAGTTYTTLKDVGRTGMIYRNDTWLGYNSTQMDFQNIGAPATNPYTDYFNEKWSDDFESGLGQWSTGTGTPALSTAQSHSATHSFIVNQDGDIIYKVFAGVHNQRAQVWFYDDATQSLAENVACVYEDTFSGGTPPTTVFATWNTAIGNKKCLGVDSSNTSSFYSAIYVVGTTISSVATVVPRATGWHLLGWDYTRGAVSMYIDGYAVGVYGGGTAPNANFFGFNIMVLGDSVADGRTGLGYFDDASIF